MNWIIDIPSIEQVVQHGTAYPAREEPSLLNLVDVCEGDDFSHVPQGECSPFGNWLFVCQHKTLLIGTAYWHPRIIVLRVIKGKIYTGAGSYLWVPAEQCPWLEQGKFLPLDQEGLPVT